MAAIMRLTTGVVYVRSVSGTLTAATLAPDTIKLDSTNQDVILARDAANTLAQRNGTNAQTFRVYNTTDGGTATSYGAIRFSTNVLEFGRFSGATGSDAAVRILASGNHSILLNTSATDRWSVNGSGHFLAFADNTYDIGANGNKPRLVYTGASTVAALPASPATGARYVVTDSNATLTAGIGAVVAGGGANVVPVFYDGTNWRIG